MAQIGLAALGVFSALNGGAQARKIKMQEAQALREAGHRKMATTTADVSELKRKKELMHSRAIAVAAASGGGVDDPGMVKVLGDLNAEGQYNVLARLYTGSTEAMGLTHQSEQAIRDGDAAMNASYLKAATTVLTAGVKNDWFSGKDAVLPEIDIDSIYDPTAFNPNSGGAMHG